MERDSPVANPLQPLHLSSDELKILEGMLQYNKDVFAWTHSNMTGIHPSIASHRLNVIPSL